MAVATLENPTAVRPFIVNKEEMGDFPYEFKSGGHVYLVYARDKAEADTVFEDFMWA